MRHKPSKRRKPAPTLAKLKAKAWGLLSEVIRKEAVFLADHPMEYAPCFTCGVPLFWQYLQAGHAIGGRTGAVLLDEEIIRPQCYRCNVALRGNYPVFVTKLIREKADQLMIEGCKFTPLESAIQWWEQKLIDSRQVRKWDRAELLEKIESYKARLEALG